MARPNKVLDAGTAIPSDDPSRTIEVDVIGFSMGGFGGAVRRVQHVRGEGRPALPHPFAVPRQQPHLGAKLAWVPTFDGRHHRHALRLGFQHAMNASRSYEIIPYARLGTTVRRAQRRTARQTPALDRQSFSLTHIRLRRPAHPGRHRQRLRGEEPYHESGIALA